MSYMVIPYAAWSSDRMKAHLDDLIRFPVGGIFLNEDLFYAAVFHAELSIIEEDDLAPYFFYKGRTFYQGEAPS